MYTQHLIVGWADMDFNAHMRNTAYLDKAADVRMLFFTQNGFPMQEFRRLMFGPVVMKDEIEYVRECHLLDELEVTFSLTGLSEDGSRVSLQNEIYREGKLAARVTTTSGWLDLNSRRLICPPPALLSVLASLDRSDPFQILPSSAGNGSSRRSHL